MFSLEVINMCMNIPQADTELMDHIVGIDQTFTAPNLWTAGRGQSSREVRAMLNLKV